eukprot:TRINITY_DN13010_c0_g1_i1.p1 TRINITY_DN13010_c0_g1~~TRINITY_DN13010_c0_g1_i1.p1  ORF type:complete len:436 (-),score=101.97 TRINITY_DN13010_c0_g1_i1:142-1449(-)
MAEEKQEIPAEFECPICAESYNRFQRNPLCLPCGHTTCQSCLKQLQSNKCPLCRSNISSKIDSCPVNFALLDVIDFVAELNRKAARLPKPVSVGADESQPVLCEESASHGSAAVFCQQCKVNLCTECDDRVHLLKVFQSHVRIPAKDKKVLVCEEHGEALKYFCESHERKICRDCREFGEHPSCRVQLISKIEAVNREAMAKLETTVRSTVEELRVLLSKSNGGLALASEKCSSAGKLLKSSEETLSASMTSLLDEGSRLAESISSLDPCSDRLAKEMKAIELAMARLKESAKELSVSAETLRKGVLKTLALKAPTDAKEELPCVKVKSCSVEKQGRRSTFLVRANKLEITAQKALVLVVRFLNPRETLTLFPCVSRYFGVDHCGGKYNDGVDWSYEEEDGTWSKIFKGEDKSFKGKARVLYIHGWSEWVQFTAR